MTINAADDIRGNMIGFFETITRGDPDAEFIRGDLIVRHRHPIPHPMLNRVLQFADERLRGGTRHLRQDRLPG